ncbi:DUF4148 domain-containing protein [Paraburkholderia acidicola]|uniref:DUF4148 domain-containing protein n=1 Tax=Paraburkholderia acidicola TaxID=1912599 RepID=A0ABV1LVM8_9BURK
MNKMLVCFTLAFGALSAPALSFAQSNGPLTRAEVRADLVRVENAGYTPSRGNDLNYPADIQAAEAKIAASNEQQKTNDAVGGVPMTGTSAAGAPVHAMKPASCVGPVSFCNIFFGS